MKRIAFFLGLVAIVTLLGTCGSKPSSLFRLLKGSATGIDFVNKIEETDSFNILTYEYIYNGGGVAVSDFNNDGLQDLFFTGNQAGNRLYLNKGGFEFEDITRDANVNVKGRWNSGVAAVDINNDGWMDLYVCATTNPRPSNRRNMLFVNQGLGTNGKPVFKDMAREYGVDFNGHSMMAAFLDYDHDGDLDLYILVNEKNSKAPTAYHVKVDDGTAANNDRLFRNNGDHTFTDVTMQAGITQEGFGLGLAVADFNKDGWPDIYVSNDFLSNDILYMNNKDGTFSNATSKLLGHESQFSMGNDVGDINNDALTDIITLDMLPEFNERKKSTIGNKTYLNYINNEKFGYQYQYVRNMLQLNGGADNGFKFSEVGQLSGIYQTEWSWSPLFVDLNNDGFRDLTITNGFPKDITDKDFANYRSTVMNLVSPKALTDSIPIVKIPNYAFRNNGDLTFTDVSASWGLNDASFSNGAAFGDLDNDGDLDYVVNNINSPAFVYENTLYSGKGDLKEASHYLRVKLKGPVENTMGLGTKVYVYHDHGKLQYHDHYIQRGYLSSVEQIIHFGLGQFIRVDSVVVQWPDGKMQSLPDVAGGQVLEIRYTDATTRPVRSVGKLPVFTEVSKKEKIQFRQEQKDVVDFNIQRTIPHKFSQSGPSLAVGDIDGDHLEDFFVGGATGIQGTFYLQQRNGEFKRSASRFTDETAKGSEDTGALLFDADNDQDLDLYIVSGGFEWQKGSTNYQDRLYKNDGRGNFTRDLKALPVMTSSGSCVRAADFDGDGDLDLFVGGRIVPAEYPYAAESYILQNDHGQFSNVTDQWCPGLKNLGMITDAVWSDFDNDGKIDLVLAGELMAVTFAKNTGSSFSLPSTSSSGYKGWWNSIAPGDFDHDGDIDYVVGNLGQNNYYHVSGDHPLKVFAKDLDHNGSVDAITGCYFRMKDGSMQLCPAHFWDELNSQSPRFRRQFSKYRQFGKVTMDKLLSPQDLEGALILEGNYSSTSYMENQGGGKFKVTPLPVEAQFAPVNGIVAYDYDRDGNLDLVMVGNDFGNEVFSGRYDAFNGLVLHGNGKGEFETLTTAASGFYVPGDAKALVRLTKGDGDIFIASQNKDSIRVFKPRIATLPAVKILPLDAYAWVTRADGKKEKIEFYYGQGFLSESSRMLQLPVDTKSVEIVDSKGVSRKVEIPNL